MQNETYFSNRIYFQIKAYIWPMFDVIAGPLCASRAQGEYNIGQAYIF